VALGREQKRGELGLPPQSQLAVACRDAHYSARLDEVRSSVWATMTIAIHR
jgi:hypothetical protein